MTINSIRKLAKNAREYKLTYALMVDGKDNYSRKDEIEHLTKLFNAH